jgi:GNAT superfamily N-acetyltransferase
LAFVLFFSVFIHYFAGLQCKVATLAASDHYRIRKEWLAVQHHHELELAERLEIRARRDFFAAAPAAFGCTLQAVVGTSATLMRAQAMPSPMLNRVVGLAGDAVLGEATWAGLRQAFSGTDFWINAWPGPGHAVLRDHLRARGCVPQGAWSLFRCELAGAPPPLPSTRTLQARLARADEAELAGEILRRSFGMAPLIVPWIAALVGRPGWQIWLACDADDVPVATAALFIDGAHAWLGMAATLPQARQRGCQQLLLATRLAAARAAGCVVAAIEAEAAPAGAVRHSLNNIVRAGFRVVGQRLNYLCTHRQA